MCVADVVQGETVVQRGALEAGGRECLAVLVRRGGDDHDGGLFVRLICDWSIVLCGERGNVGRCSGVVGNVT